MFYKACIWCAQVQACLLNVVLGFSVFAKTEHHLGHISVFCSLLARMLMLTHFFILVETRHNKLSDYFYLAKSDTGSFFYKLIVAEQKKSAIFNFLNANYLASLWSTRNCLHFDQWISDNHANSDLKDIHLWYFL